ncbi:TPA: peptidoglycan-binding protein [Clostridioides difficile]|nr:peptidoglycan-binding protein [Clostridioides difficile]
MKLYPNAEIFIPDDKSILSSNVHCVQLLLRQLNYNLGLDSAFAPSIYNAVTHFQREHGLTSDGVLGYNTFDGMASRLHM